MVTYLRYGLSRGTHRHEWLLDVDSKLIRGEACTSAAVGCKISFTPDGVVRIPGGKTLFLRDVWPAVPLVLPRILLQPAWSGL